MGVAMVLLAGGSSTRLGSRGNKAYVDLAGRPLLSYSLETFERSRSIDDVVVVVRDGERALAVEVADRLGATKVARVVAGGDTRYASERAGIMAAASIGDVDVVGVHDAARPFATIELVECVVGEARRVGGALPMLPVEEDLYEVGPDGAARRGPHDLVRAQTPQVFRTDPLVEAFERAAATKRWAGVDTAETVERHVALEIAAVPGDSRNVKITYERDLAVCVRLAAAWVAGRWR